MAVIVSVPALPEYSGTYEEIGEAAWGKGRLRLYSSQGYWMLGTMEDAQRGVGSVASVEGHGDRPPWEITKWKYYIVHSSCWAEAADIRIYKSTDMESASGMWSVIGAAGAVVREDEALNSAVVQQLPQGAHVRVLEVRGRRAMLANPHGWVSISAKTGEQILAPLGDAAETYSALSTTPAQTPNQHTPDISYSPREVTNGDQHARGESTMQVILPIKVQYAFNVEVDETQAPGNVRLSPMSQHRPQILGIQTGQPSIQSHQAVRTPPQVAAPMSTPHQAPPMGTPVQSSHAPTPQHLPSQGNQDTPPMGSPLQSSYMQQGSGTPQSQHPQEMPLQPVSVAMGTPMQSSYMASASTPQNLPVGTPQQPVQVTAQQGPHVAVTPTPQQSSLTPQNYPMGTPQHTAQLSPQNAPMGTPQQTPQNHSIEALQQFTPRGLSHVSATPPMGTPQQSVQATPQNYPMGTPQHPAQPTPQNAPAGTPQLQGQATPQNAPAGTPQLPAQEMSTATPPMGTPLQSSQMEAAPSQQLVSAAMGTPLQSSHIGAVPSQQPVSAAMGTPLQSSHIGAVPSQQPASAAMGTPLQSSQMEAVPSQQPVSAAMGTPLQSSQQPVSAAIGTPLQSAQAVPSQQPVSAAMGTPLQSSHAPMGTPLQSSQMQPTPPAGTPQQVPVSVSHASQYQSRYEGAHVMMASQVSMENPPRPANSQRSTPQHAPVRNILETAEKLYDESEYAQEDEPATPLSAHGKTQPVCEELINATAATHTHTHGMSMTGTWHVETRDCPKHADSVYTLEVLQNEEGRLRGEYVRAGVQGPPKPCRGQYNKMWRISEMKIDWGPGHTSTLRLRLDDEKNADGAHILRGEFTNDYDGTEGKVTVVVVPPGLREDVKTEQQFQEQLSDVSYVGVPLPVGINAVWQQEHLTGTDKRQIYECLERDICAALGVGSPQVKVIDGQVRLATIPGGIPTEILKERYDAAEVSDQIPLPETKAVLKSLGLLMVQSTPDSFNHPVLQDPFAGHVPCHSPYSRTPLSPAETLPPNAVMKASLSPSGYAARMTSPVRTKPDSEFTRRLQEISDLRHSLQG